MRTIIILYLFLAIIGFAAIGVLYIFDVKTGQESFELLLKTEGAILLFGGCSVVVSLLLAGANKSPQD